MVVLGRHDRDNTRTEPLSSSGHPRPPSGGYTTRMSEPVFFKSGHRSGEGECVEVAFRKSSYSGTGNNYIGAADTPTATLVRDTRNRAAGHLGFAPGEWAALLNTLDR